MEETPGFIDTGLSQDDPNSANWQSDGWIPVEIPLRVGFDLMKIRVDIDPNVNWDLLKSKTEGVNLHPSGDRPERVLDICRKEQVNRFCYLRIDLPYKDYLTVKKENKKGAPDSCILCVHVKPLKDHPDLGNIRNFSCKEAIDEVKRIYKILDREYGIRLVNTAILSEVECNINFVYRINTKDEGARHPNQFVDLVRMLTPHQLYLEKFATTTNYDIYPENVYYRRNQGRNYFDGDLLEIIRKPGDIGVMSGKKVSNLTSRTEKRKVSIYNKSLETENKSKKKIQFLQQMTRIEYKLKGERIQTYYGKSDLFDMTQDDLDAAFHKMSEKCLKQPIEKYYSRMDKDLEEYFRSVDINIRGWRNKLVLDLTDKIQQQGGFYYIISEEELRNCVREISAKSVSKNAYRIVKSLKEYFDNAGDSCVSIREDRIIYKILKWLCTVNGKYRDTTVYYRYKD